MKLVVKSEVEIHKRVKKVGNSLMIPLTEAFKKIGINVGDSVVVHVNEDKGEIVIKPNRSIQLPEGLDQEFFDAYERLMRRHYETLDELKDK